METVAFQSWPQITDYRRIYQKWGIETTSMPFDELALWYPENLINGAKRFYELHAETVLLDWRGV